MSYVSKEQIERAKQLDLLTYLQVYEPAELVRCSRNVYTTRTHDSLKISNGKWYWWSRGIGGRSALDYLIKVQGMSFPDAVLQIEGIELGRTSHALQSLQQGLSSTKFVLPEPYITSNRVITYLRNRGIHSKIIDYCLETGRLYESSRYHNAVFVGFNQEGTPRYAAIRGTTNTRFMGEAVGSDKRYSFSIPAMEDSTELHLFESAIDLLSYCTLEHLAGRDWRQAHKLSLAGIYSPKANGKESTPPAALTHYLHCFPKVNRLVLHLDNDEPGKLAAATMKRLLSPILLIFDEPPNFGKDVNNDLMEYRRRRGELSR
ncbi:DUF3991 and toprim domain-containing protein [Paenibacillus sp. J5C_2022]|uniref:DUF3991 and TOPRIM domain-containing protein n=1 Tax=Paenibacillus sp. J5C2022 TaxID=2977129 RepID=UPI0021CF0498|nr:DUF3991 and TOPRIM domain-containing protein [Paenibacillus sp. J5C2022]MCU6711504.1 DUF3991 and toprim domain-containing protein [Paenibacillus sp. J5C2022]